MSPIRRKTIDVNKPPTQIIGSGKTTVDVDKPVFHLTTPEAAIQVARAAGEFGDKVALGCFSVSNFGVFSASEQGIGLFARGATTAAQFEGDVEISTDCRISGALHVTGDVFCTGDIQLTGRDYAENFGVSGDAASGPGSVMVLDDEGGVRLSALAYDRRVAGVISGAGDCKPAIILGHDAGDRTAQPLALMGKVFCMVDATESPVSVGDLLTTSATPGHAMKATDAARAFGAVIGKALRPLATGRALVPILVALQ